MKGMFSVQIKEYSSLVPVRPLEDLAVNSIKIKIIGVPKSPSYTCANFSTGLVPYRGAPSLD